MKKISVIVAGLALASSQVSALDIQYFIGAGAEYSKQKLKVQEMEKVIILIQKIQLLK